jgi:hypothetical protein
MGIGAQRINLAAMLANSRVIAQAAVLGTAPVLAELELVREVAVLEPAAARVIVRGAEPVLALVQGVVPEQAIDLAAVPEQAIALAEALVLIIVPAEVQAQVIALAGVRVLVIAPVAAELVRALAVKVATAQPHGHLAVPAKTKSVTALHRRDLAAVLTVEDLAAAEAETTLEPVAAEAVTAWEAAE